MLGIPSVYQMLKIEALKVSSFHKICNKFDTVQRENDFVLFADLYFLFPVKFPCSILWIW